VGAEHAAASSMTATPVKIRHVNLG
jgi:hypothetical protein